VIDCACIRRIEFSLAKNRIAGEKSFLQLFHDRPSIIDISSLRPRDKCQRTVTGLTPSDSRALRL